MEAKNKILFVIIITLVTMVAEIIFGIITNSMALLADGFHMGTHVFALGLSYVAYHLCQKYANSVCFTNGTDKIKELAGYTSSLFLGASALLIIYNSIERLLQPLSIEYNQAMLLVIIGLVVNVASILIMDSGECCHLMHHHHHHHNHDDRDNNFKAAYFHILADVITSLLALGALLVGKFFGFVSLDPLIGVLGGFIILKWSIDLIKATAINLLDMDLKKED